MNDLLTMAQTEGLLDMLLLPFKDAPQSNPNQCGQICSERITQYLKQQNDLFKPLEITLAKEMYTDKNFGYCDTCHEGTNGRAVKIIDFEGQMLFQGVHDKVPIKLLASA